MFYSAYAFMHHLGMPEGGEETYMWKKGYSVMELSLRMYPFQRFGGATELFVADGKFPDIDDFFTSTLLALFAAGRLVT